MPFASAHRRLPPAICDSDRNYMPASKPIIARPPPHSTCPRTVSCSRRERARPDLIDPRLAAVNAVDNQTGFARRPNRSPEAIRNLTSIADLKTGSCAEPGQARRSRISSRIFSRKAAFRAGRSFSSTSHRSKMLKFSRIGWRSLAMARIVRSLPAGPLGPVTSHRRIVSGPSAGFQPAQFCHVGGRQGPADRVAEVLTKLFQFRACHGGCFLWRRRIRGWRETGALYEHLRLSQIPHPFAFCRPRRVTVRVA